MNTTTLLILFLLLSEDKRQIKTLLPTLLNLLPDETPPIADEKKETDDTEVSLWLKKLMESSPKS